MIDSLRVTNSVPMSIVTLGKCKRYTNCKLYPRAPGHEAPWSSSRFRVRWFCFTDFSDNPSHSLQVCCHTDPSHTCRASVLLHTHPRSSQVPLFQHSLFQRPPSVISRNCMRPNLELQLKRILDGVSVLYLTIRCRNYICCSTFHVNVLCFPV